MKFTMAAGVESYITFNNGGVSTSPTNRRALSGTDDTAAIHRAKPGGAVGLPGGWVNVHLRPSHETLRVLFSQPDHDGRTLQSIDEALSQVGGRASVRACAVRACERALCKRVHACA